MWWMLQILSTMTPEHSEELPKVVRENWSRPHPDLEHVDPFFESTLKILGERRFCLSDETLELVARQKFPSPRIADHAMYCPECRSKVLEMRKNIYGSR